MAAAACTGAAVISKAEALKRLRKKRAPPEEAAEALADLRSGGYLSVAREYSTAVSACCNGEKWALAVGLLDEMHSQDMEPSPAAFTAALLACERCRQEGQVQRLKALWPALGSMEAEEAEDDTVATPPAASAPASRAAKGAAPAAAPTAKAVAAPAASAVASSGDRVRYSRGALAQRLRWRLAEDPYLKETLAMLNEDGHLRTEDNEGLKGYVATLRSLEYGEHWQWALHVLGQMREGSPDTKNEHSIVAHNVAISACSRCSEWQRSLLVMEEMPLCDFHPDFETYQAAASSCSRAGQWQGALSLIMRGVSEGAANGESYSIAMMAAASAKEWQAALALLADADASPVKEAKKDVLFYGIAIFGCMQGQAWTWCLQLLDDMRASKIQPDAMSYACASQACKDARKDAAANELLMEMRRLKVGDQIKDVLGEGQWILDTPEMRNPIPMSALEPMASKEVSLFKFVQRRATPGDVDSVIQAIERFAIERQWLKVQGEQKKELLEASIRPTDRIVEFGCYVGYSSLVMARRLRQLGRQGSVTTCEVDAAVAYVARAVHLFAGAEGEVQVRVGCASDWVTTGQLGIMDFLLLDHRGTIYHEDLHAAEPSLSPTARVFADNVLYPGAPLFLNYIDVQGYKIKIHELKEFLRPDLDDWVVICEPPPPEERKPMPRATPPEMRRLSAEVDAISWRSQEGPVDWVAFQERLKPVFYKWKEERGL